MSSPLTSVSASRSDSGKPGGVAPRIITRRKKRIDHAEIVRMAEAAAQSRAAERHEMIATAAYFRAQQRGFEPGHELEDWLAAESEVTHAQQVSAIVSGADVP
ncbi:MAG TPA: DUF2934 domain-containing protein [Steroidobacter sp.]|uniref:DUF2934 domain-containing protein n=1 Tax=Steroidobacter sp. TaxID=1978227 RepID=UPI002ED8DB83